MIDCWSDTGKPRRAVCEISVRLCTYAALDEVEANRVESQDKDKDLTESWWETNVWEILVVEPHSRTWTLSPAPKITGDFPFTTKEVIYSEVEKISTKEWCSASYLWIVSAEAIKRDLLSEDHELATGGERRARVDG